MYVTCDCGSDTYHIRFVPPVRGIAVCTECGNEQEIGGDTRP